MRFCLMNRRGGDANDVDADNVDADDVDVDNVDADDVERSAGETSVDDGITLPLPLQSADGGGCAGRRKGVVMTRERERER